METFTPGPDRQRDFRDALGRFATGVTIVTCYSARGPLGITANSFASVSLDPPLVLWSPARASARFAAFTEADRYAIHVVAEDQVETCLRFTKGGDDWDGLAWRDGPHGAPVLDHCLARFDCAPEAIHDGGDHAIVVGRVLEACRGEGRPLLFADGTYGRGAVDDGELQLVSRRLPLLEELAPPAVIVGGDPLDLGAGDPVEEDVAGGRRRRRAGSL